MISWNVNGIRAVLKKDFMEFFTQASPDIFAIQESKITEGLLDLDTPGYHQYWSYADKKGYSGTAVFSKEEPLEVLHGLGIDEHDHEGRICALKFENFWFVDVYTPNSQNQLARLDYRMSWDDAFRGFVSELAQEKPVITCGDFNVAHKEIDLRHPKANRRNAGFTDEERNKFTELLEAGFIDSFRYFYPDLEDMYSWWSYRTRARDTNAGWRIDYFLVSDCLENKLKDAKIRTDIFGSDHCPVELLIEV
ncbi:MAG: exodeoxyribonuclease III [Coriobacteriia bacterium]|nr:exodeoxyribonuclease III [Coriobacteriia bacterium]